MSESQNSQKKLNLLQIFRGLASVFVLLVHGTALFHENVQQVLLANIFTFGYAGVDFFFVLSGFIIFYIHRNDIGNKIKLKDFILKRFIRVYPVYWIILIPRLLFTGKNPNFITCITSFTLFPYPSPPIVNVSWTLSYEVFFYLIFGLMIFYGVKYLRPLIIIWITIILLYWTLHSFNIVTLPEENLFLKFILSGHLLEFIFGCLVAYITTKYKVKQGTIILILGIILFALSAIADVYLVNSTNANLLSATSIGETQIAKNLTPMYEFPFVYYGIPSMLIVLGAVALDFNREIRIPNFLIYLGDASYSVYLVHASVINITTNLIAKLHWQSIFENDLLKLLVLASALMIGCLFHSFIEQPLLTTIRKKIFIPKVIIKEH